MLFNEPLGVFGSQLARPAAFVPEMDVAVGAKDLVLTMDVPGFTSADLSLTVEDDQLIVRGARRRPELPDGMHYARVERSAGAFERRVRVPHGIDPDTITASLTDGVLSLIVPKPERLQPRTIAINAEPATREIETATA